MVQKVFIATEPCRFAGVERLGFRDYQIIKSITLRKWLQLARSLPTWALLAATSKVLGLEISKIHII